MDEDLKGMARELLVPAVGTLGGVGIIVGLVWAGMFRTADEAPARDTGAPEIAAPVASGLRLRAAWQDARFTGVRVPVELSVSDGGELVVGAGDGWLVAWDGSTGNPRWSVPMPGPSALALSAGGSRIAVGLGSELRVIGADRGAARLEWRDPADATVEYAAWVAGGARLSTSWSGPAPGVDRHRLWEADGTLVWEADGRAWVAPDGRRAVLARDDGVALVDLTAGREVLLQRCAAPTQVDIARSGLAAVAAGQRLCAWDLGTGRRMLAVDGPVRGVVASDDGRRALSWTDEGEVVAWDLLRARALWREPGTSVRAAGLAGQSAWVVRASAALEVETGVSVGRVPVAWTGAWAASGTRLVHGDGVGAGVLTLPRLERIAAPSCHRFAITALDAHRGSLVTGDAGGSGWRWSDDAGEPVLDGGGLVRAISLAGAEGVRRIGGVVGGAALLPDRATAVVLREGQHVLLDLADGATRSAWPAWSSAEDWRFAGLAYGAFAPGGTVFLSSQDGVVRERDLASGAVVNTLVSHGDRPARLALSDDGTWLASADWDGAVVLWKAVEGVPVRELLAGPAEVAGVAFDARGQRVAAALRAPGRVLTWRVPDGALLAEAPVSSDHGRPTAVGFVGDELVVGTSAGALLRYEPN